MMLMPEADPLVAEVDNHDSKSPIWWGGFPQGVKVQGRRLQNAGYLDPG
jgi:hypothetical protein